MSVLVLFDFGRGGGGVLVIFIVVVVVVVGGVLSDNHSRAKRFSFVKSVCDAVFWRKSFI